MKEIKFRQWDGCEFHYWGLLADEGMVSPTSGRNRKGDVFGAKNTTHEQYTGLKDKSGVEIYEGDILNNTNGYSHCDVKSVAEFKNGRFECFQSVSWNDGTSTSSYVIGNIHENPELLEVVK